LLLARLGILCSILISGWLSLSARLRAATLLVVLVAHLAFMASPLHERMLTGAVYAAVTVPASNDSASVQVDMPESGDHHAVDCALQWIKGTQPTAALGSLVAALATASPGWIQHMPGMRPVARAIEFPIIFDTFDGLAFHLVSVHYVGPRPAVIGPPTSFFNWTRRNTLLRLPFPPPPAPPTYLQQHVVVIQNPNTTAITVACRAYRLTQQ
jgi:hypothetical protein